MKRLLVLLVLLVCPILAVAQSEERDMRTLLQDSSYVFNRFEETTTGLDFQIDSWNVPASLKTTLKEVLSGRLRSVRAEKMYYLISYSTRVSLKKILRLSKKL